MIQVSKPKKDDLPALQYLMQQYGKFTIDANHLNPRDIALQARNTDNGEVAGFVWLGLMANSTVGYIDKFIVHPDYKNKGIGKLLANHALEACVKRGIKEVFGLIKQDQYHDASAFNALRMAMTSDNASYTLVQGNIAHTVAELKALGE